MYGTLLIPLLLLAPLGNGASAPDAEPEAASIEQLIQDLGSPSYAIRRDAESALEAKGESALAALKAAMENDPNPEVAWRAKQLVRRLTEADGEDEATVDLDLPRGWLDHDLDDMFGSLFERLERDFGFDIPRRSFFHDDFFTDLRDQMAALREHDDSRFEKTGETIQRSRAFRVNVTDGGVVVEIEEQDGNGENTTRKYEAESLQKFRELYPEIAREYIDGKHDALALRFRPDRFFGRVAPARMPTHEDDRVEERRLGILAHSIGKELRTYLDLPDDRGVRVEEVRAGSLAERLGLERNDVLLTIDGRPIATPGDVPAALAAAKESVRVSFDRKGRKLERTASLTHAETDG